MLGVLNNMPNYKVTFECTVERHGANAAEAEAQVLRNYPSDVKVIKTVRTSYGSGDYFINKQNGVIFKLQQFINGVKFIKLTDGVNVCFESGKSELTLENVQELWFRGVIRFDLQPITWKEFADTILAQWYRSAGGVMRDGITPSKALYDIECNDGTDLLKQQVAAFLL